MPNLDIPGAGVISFPDDMPKEQIRDIVEKQIMPKAQSRIKLSGAGGFVPNDFHANMPAPTASGRGNPLLAALGLSQVGPFIASGMQPGVWRTLVEQVNAQNLALGKMIPAAWPMSSIGKNIVRSLIAAQAMPGVGTAVGQAFVDQPGGQRREDITQAGLGVVQGFAAPRVGEMTGELAGRGLSALGALLPKAPAPIPVRQGPYPGQPGYAEAINKTLLPPPQQGPVAKPAPPEPVTPSPFDKGKVMPNQTVMPTRDALRAEVSDFPTEELTKRYAGTQAVAKMLLQQGRLDEASVLITRGQFMREELEKRTSSSKATPDLPGVVTSSIPLKQTEPTAPPLSFQPAIRRGTTIYPGIDHGKITVELLKQDVAAKKAGQPLLPRPERGFVGSDGKFYTTLEAARAKMQQPKLVNQPQFLDKNLSNLINMFGPDSIQATTYKQTRSLSTALLAGKQPVAQPLQPKEQNVQASQQARPEETQKLSAPQSNVQKEVPGNVGEAVRGARGGDEQGAAGLKPQPAQSGLLSNPNSGPKPEWVKWIEDTKPEDRNEAQAEDLARWQQGKKPLYYGQKNKPNRGKTTSESGFILFPGGKASIGKDLGIKGGTKVNGEQLYNRIRNVLGEGSGEFKYWTDAGLKGFLASPKTTGEVEKWMNEKGPKVEVRKFGEGVQQDTPAIKEANEIQHKIDSLGFRIDSAGRLTRRGSDFVWDKDNPNITPEMHQLLDRYSAIQEQASKEAQQQRNNASHWSFIAPKSEQDMPGYVEIAVVKPRKTIRNNPETADDFVEENKYPSSHHFPPNTLGFVRGYMETDPKTGEKTFHVIETQSDWAQRIREDLEDMKPHRYESDAQMEGVKQAWRNEKGDPLLAHYERLALKAAIEHARAEGATRIAVSDAETAMMTEGHDRQGSEISQQQGMRLHYDQTLPKILSELTGERGERVGFGKHRMAFEPGSRENPQGPVDDVPSGQRKDLIFKDEKGQPKTTVTARSFPLTNTRKEFSMFGSDKAVKPRTIEQRMANEGGFIQVPPQVQKALVDFYEKTKQVGTDLKSFFDDMSGESGHAIVNTLRGTDLPRTAAADKDVANKLYTYAQANAVSDVLAHTDPTEVLGSHWNDPLFDRKLGGVLVEYNLRQTGNTSVGKSWSPFKTDAAYEAAIKDPEILDAIRRHAEIVLAPAEARHTALGGKKITLPAPEAFVNLKYVPKEEGGMKAASGGLLKATLQRKTRFGQSRAGTGDEYEVSYRKLAERMVKGNYAEDLRQKLNDAYVEKGLGVYVKPGDVIPEGMQEVPLKVQRAIIVPEGEGAPTMVNQNKSLYIKKELMPEYLQAMQANIKTSVGGLRKVAEVLTKLQVSLGVDAVQHTVSMVSAVNGAVRPALGKNLIGVREIDTISQIVKNVSDVIHDKPEVQHLIGEMARDYGIAREHKTYEGLFGGKNRAGELIRIVDHAGRVTLFQIARALADAGMIKNDPVVIREFVNKQLGQYNAGLMSSVNQFAKATFAPFMVAGKTFNRLAATRLLMSPQIKAASPKTWALMRARQALYVASAVVIVPAVANYLSTGSVFGGPDTRFGEIDLGEKGRFDMAKWTLLRRGARISGLQAVGEQQIMPRLRGEPPAALGQTAKQVFSDVGRGQLAPYAGPPVNALATLTTGKSTLGYEARQPGEKYPYFAAAGRQLNPLIGSTIEGADQGKGLLAGSGKRLEQMAGSRTSNDLTVIRQLARQFNYKQGKASETDFAPSEYVPLLNAVRDGRVDEAKKLTEALVAEKGEKVVEQYFKDLPNKRFTGNKEREEEFVKSLTPHQQDVYAKAKAQNEATAKAFFEQILGKPVPTKGPKNSFGRLGLGHF